MTERDYFRRLADEQLAIFRTGGFVGADGAWVDLSARIAASVDGSVEIADAAPTTFARGEATEISLAAEDAIAGLWRLAGEGCRDIAALNFASARSPGGGFLRGGRAQEESLCRATTLYPALESATTFYDRNRAWPDDFYADAILYSPDIVVMRDSYGALMTDGPVVGVITAPAPNRRAAEGKGAAPRAHTADAALRKRAAMILRAAIRFERKALVLGAWGCGVFGNPPDAVAGIFAELLSGEFANAFERVHFAVPDAGSDQNFEAFARRFPRV